LALAWVALRAGGRYAHRRADEDGGEAAALLGESDLALLGQVQAGGEGAAPGRASPQRARRRRFTLQPDSHLHFGQQPVERLALGGLREHVEDARAGVLDGVEVEHRRAIDGYRVHHRVVEQVQGCPEELDDVDLVLGRHRQPDELGFPAGEHVAAQLGPACKPGRECLHLPGCEQGAAQPLGFCLGRALLACAGRQQEARAQQREPGRHDQPAHFLTQQCRRALLQGPLQLLDERRQRDAGQIDLMRARERQQRLERPAEPVQIEVRRRCRFPRRPGPGTRRDRAVHRRSGQPSAAGRGWRSAKRSSGQRAPSRESAGRGSSSAAVKKP
jgi:hypothetical protein